MRLINVKTHRLEDFTDHPPSYAILSHTWGDEAEELTLRDIQDAADSDLLETKPGIGAVKFLGCCAQAERDGLQYAWIDTCCIDKTNLVELSEAINSMFRWYSDAAVCYAYLSDVPADDPAPKEGSRFLESRWFRRGWTLQELLAPEHVRFYNADWVSIGTKGSMCAAIGKVTGVPRHFLLGITDLHTASIAQRMSWAARRDTKKKEDLAYCLLGLFGVTMPLIYGEGGEQAFFRLQEQIMKTTRDDSLLAWGIMGADEPSIASSSSSSSLSTTSLSSSTTTTTTTTTTIRTATATTTVTTTTTPPPPAEPEQVIPGRILAAAPSDFANSGHIVQREQTSTTLNTLTMSGGSLGINISLFTGPDGQLLGLLNCRPEHDDEHLVGIPLSKLAGLSDEYVRPKGDYTALRTIGPAPAVPAAAVAPPTAIHIKHVSERNMSKGSMDIRKFYWLYESDQLSEAQLSLLQVEPKTAWDKERALITAVMQSDDPMPHRTLARFRHAAVPDKEAGALGSSSSSSSSSSSKPAADFVMILEFSHDPVTGIKAECCVMTCSRKTETADILAKADYFVQRARGTTSASNGPLNLAVELEPLEKQPIFIIRPKAVAAAPETTIDATSELEKFHLMLEFTSILKEKSQNDARDTFLGQEALKKAAQLDRIRKDREALEAEIRKLAERRNALLGDESRLRADLYRDTDEQAAIKDKETDARDRWLQAQTQWISLCGATNINNTNNTNNTSTANPTATTTHTTETVHELDIMASRTPLLWAAENGDADTVRLLLYQGADVTAADREGHTPFTAALYQGHSDVVRLLLSTGKIDINARHAESGQAPLAWAAATGLTPLVSALLDTGRADIHAKDKHGWTALRWAAEKKHDDVVDLLLKHGAAPAPQPLVPHPATTPPMSPPRQSQERERERERASRGSTDSGSSGRTADYSKAMDSRLLDKLVQATSSIGPFRGRVSRAMSDEKKPRARTWFSLEGKKAAQQQQQQQQQQQHHQQQQHQQQPAQHPVVSMVIAEGKEDGVYAERRRTS